MEGKGTQGALTGSQQAKSSLTAKSLGTDLPTGSGAADDLELGGELSPSEGTGTKSGASTHAGSPTAGLKARKPER